MKLSFITVLGIIVSLTMLLTGVFTVTGHFEFYETFPFLADLRFLNIPSLLIVLGGVLNSIFIMYPAAYVGRALASFFYLFSQSRYIGHSLQKEIAGIVRWSERVQENKRKAAVEIQDEQKKEIAGYLFTLINTNYSNDQIRTFGKNNIEENFNRKMMTVDTLSSMGNASPAFGMFGTLFGLIVMLGSLEDPARMGPGLAAALITTLYGITLAHLIFIPLSRKLRNLAIVERFRDYLIMEGVLLINDNQSPFYIEDKLYSFLRRDVTMDNMENGNKEESSKPAA